MCKFWFNHSELIPIQASQTMNVHDRSWSSHSAFGGESRKSRDKHLCGFMIKGNEKKDPRQK
jgi:hypothetical protein